MPHRYRKKPVEVEAAHFRIKQDTGEDNGEVIAEWCGGTYYPAVEAEEFEDGKGHPAMPAHILIPTLEGTMTASLNDYVVKGTVGEFYPCKSEPFLDVHELVDDGAPVTS